MCRSMYGKLDGEAGGREWWQVERKGEQRGAEKARAKVTAEGEGGRERGWQRTRRES